MKIQDFHKTNSYELTNHCVDTFKTHAISGNQQRWSWQPKIKSLEDLFHLLIVLSLNNTFVWLQTCNITVLLLMTMLCCTILLICCDTCMTSSNPRTFPPYPGLGVWQIGIRAIGYSELVNFLNEKEIQNLRL